MGYLMDDRLYRIWSGMRYRCRSPKCKSYKYYGGRGIGVCEEWGDFKVFKAWALGNGYRDDLTIDRIDCDKGYSPENCRWATYKEQRANQHEAYTFTDKKREDRTHKRYEIDGEVKSFAYWCRKYNIRQETVTNRLKRGFSFKAALMIPKYMRVSPEEAEAMLREKETIIVGEIPSEFITDEYGNKLQLME